jgi:carboxypeptidase family protein
MLRKRVSSGEVLVLLVVTGVLFLAVTQRLSAQSNSGVVQGTITDPSGGAVPGAKVRIENPVSGHVNEVETATDGSFRIPNLPLNPYHLTVTAQGFGTSTQDVDVRSTVPITLTIALKIGSASTNITVTENAADLLEVTATEHTDVDRGLFEELPLESPSSSVSSLITLASPGIVADSNGLFHGLGDHAENSFSVDGQPITDQQSKIFSNQIPADSIQAMEVIEGAPPAEFGGKTSVIVKVTTRSGLGIARTNGSVNMSYGRFGAASPSFDLAFGNQKWGNFVAANGLQTSRFLDPPEFTAFHDKGNEENIFDRADYKISNADTLQLNLQYTRSRFQTPDSYDQLNSGVTDPITGAVLDPADQGSYIRTFNVAPSWTRVIGSSAVFTLGAFARQDVYTYYPSADPFADFSPGLQSESIGQNRKLTNLGARSDYSYVKGIHNMKFGVTFAHTLLTEDDRFGIVDPGLVPSLADANGNPCVNASGVAIASPCTDLAPFDLTAGGTFFNFHGHADVRELAFYAEDSITKGPWSINLGLRGDLYRGLAKDVGRGLRLTEPPPAETNGHRKMRTPAPRPNNLPAPKTTWEQIGESSERFPSC